MKTLIGFVVVILLTACSPALKFQESFVSKELNFNSLKNSSITVYGTSNIILTEFVETFKSEYSDTTKLNNKIITDFKEHFAKQIPTATIKSGVGKIPSALIGELSFNQNNISQVDNFFKSINTDYMLFVSALEVGNAYQTYTHYNNNMAMTNSTEECKVETDIEAWDVKNQKRIFKIKSYGSSTVILFTFLNSLNSALSEAIENGVKYIADNGKK